MTRGSLVFYVARRLVALVVLVVVISFVVFSLLYLAPGSPEQVLLGARPATPETIEAIREEYHLNDPFLVQYAKWAKGALQLRLRPFDQDERARCVGHLGPLCAHAPAGRSRVR